MLRVSCPFGIQTHSCYELTYDGNEISINEYSFQNLMYMYSAICVVDPFYKMVSMQIQMYYLVDLVLRKTK